MMGPRAQPKARRPPNLYIANPDSGSDESGDEVKPLERERDRPPPTHPTLTLITQPPTPAVQDDQLAQAGRPTGSDHPYAASAQRYRAAEDRQMARTEDSATSSGTHFREPMWNQPSASAGLTKPKGRASTSPSDKHDPPGASGSSEALRTVSDGSIRTLSRPERPLPKPSSPPSIPLPQPPLRQRASGSSDPAIPSQLSPAYSSHPPTSTSSENRRAGYPGDGSHSPVQASPASSGSQHRPFHQIGIPHHGPSGSQGSSVGTPAGPAVRLGNVRLQVTTNSDDFSVVDISGLASAEAIMERVFSKLRIRDEDYGSHMMFQTDIGETEHTHPIPPTQLLSLCNSLGDSKGNLKFYVKQVALPQSTATSAIPPPVLDIGVGSTTPQSVQFTPGAASHRSRGTGSVSSAGKPDKTPLRVNRGTHSKQGSYSSTGELAYSRPEYASPTMLDAEAERAESVDADVTLGGPLVGKPSLTRNHRMVSQRHRLPSTTGSRNSRSPAEDGRRTMTQQYASPPPSFGALSSPSLSSASANSLSAGQMVDLAVPGSGVDGKGIRRGSVTPTMPTFAETSKSDGPAELPYLMDTPHARFLEGATAEDPFVDSPPLVMPESSILQQQQREAMSRQYQPPSSAHDDWVLSSPSEPTEADLAVVRRLEDEEREREARQKRQLEEDERLAQIEQQKEHEAFYWEQQRQMETDRLAAEAALQQEREQASAARREIERLERERERLVGRERRERRTQWEAMHQAAPAAPAQDPTPDRMKQWISSVATDPEIDRLHSLAARPAGPGGSPTSPHDPRAMADYGSSFAGPGPSSAAYRQGYQQAPRAQSPYMSAAPRQTGPARLVTHPQPSPAPAFNSGHPFAAQQGRLSPSSGGQATMPTLEADRFRRQYAGGPSSGSNVAESDYTRRSATATPSERYGQGRDGGMHNAYGTLGYREDLGRYPSTGSSPQMHSRQLSRSGSRQDMLGSRGADNRPRGDAGSTPNPRVAHPFANPACRVEANADQVLNFPQAVPYAGSHSRGASAGSLTWMQEAGYLNQRRGSAGQASADKSPPMPDIDAGEETLWLVPPAPSANSMSGSSRSISGESSASSVMSQATARPVPISRKTGNSEDDSGDTARAGDWADKLGKMLNPQTAAADADGTIINVKPRSKLSSPAVDDGAEETLWFTPPSAQVPRSAKEAESVVSPGRPSLRLDTQVRQDASNAAGEAQSASLSSSEPPTSTATDSDANEEAGAKVQRHRSFARNKENQWNFRPPAEHVYNNLEEFFPKIDLDKPVVAAADALPHIDESPRTASPDGFQDGMQRAPQRVPSSSRQAGFNKADARKSIRVVAEGRRKHLSRMAPAVTARQTPLERKRSSSMWGHKVVEVTPSKLRTGKIPENEDGSSAAQSTMTWVKGELIGKGTYGRVYLALNATTGEFIAVKQVEMPRSERDREDARHASMIEALKGEIALLKDLEHSNVVEYLGWEESKRYLSIFLEYVDGGSIASVYRRHKKFEEGVIKSFTRQILDGLAYLHSLHILHRDLKADNVLVDSHGICKISDFGISKRTDDAYDSVVSTNLKGSVFWMAPEVVHSVKGQGYSAKVDIWSLGCVVLEMWAGRRPWGDMEALAAMFQLANSRAAPPVPDDVVLSPVAEDFLNRQCFASNPHDRPTAAELLAHRFITDVDPTWTFANSGIGRAVAANMKGRGNPDSTATMRPRGNPEGSSTVRPRNDTEGSATLRA